MVTLMFEMSMQMVNPKLSLPYWDFTIDAYLVDKNYGGDYDHLRDVSDLWTPEWFGGVDPADYQVCVFAFHIKPVLLNIDVLELIAYLMGAFTVES